MGQVYSLPTQRYAGRFIIELDPAVDWSGVPGVIVASDGTGWLDYARLPVPGGTENRIISYEIADGADLPVRTLRATLHMATEHGSLSSGAVDSPFNRLAGSFSPAIFGGRRVIVQDPLGDPNSLNPTDWRPRFWGRLDDPRANHAGDLTLFGRDLSALLMIPYTGEEVWIGTEGELVPLDEAIQRVLDVRFGEAEWVLKSPGGDLEWAIPAFPMENVENVLAYIREMAQQRGAVVRWWPDEPTGRFQLSLFVLQQDKPAPDFTYSAGETEDIPYHGSDIAPYRNDFTLEFRDGATDELHTIHRPATEAERRSFGLQPLKISEASTSHINTVAEATVMLDSIEAALRVPATVASRQIPRNPLVEVNSRLRFAADGRVAQETTDLYVVNWTERVAISGGRLEESTIVEMRGAPVGQIGAWLRSIEGAPLPAPAPTLPYLSKVRQMPGSDPLHVDLALTVEDPEGRLGTLRAWLSRSSPDDADPTGDPDGTLAVTAIPTDVGPSTTWAVSGGTAAILDEVRIHPGRGKAVFFEYVTNSGESTGVVRFTLRPTGGVVGEDGDIIPGIIDSEDLFAEGYSPVRVVGSQAEMDALPPSSQIAVLNGKIYRRNDLGEWTAAVDTVDLVGEIVANTVADGSITTAHFAAGIEPIHVETGPELPSEQITELVYWQGKLYRWNETEEAYEEYVAATGAITIVNTENIAEAAVTASKIAQQAVTTAKLAQEAVTADIIAAGAITAEKLLVGVGPNLIPNGDFRTGDVDGWRPVAGTGGITVVPRSETAVTEASGATHVLRFQRETSGNVGIYSHTTPQNEAFGGIRVRAGEQYRVGVRYAMEAGTNPGTSSLLVTAYLDNGTVATVHNSGALPFATAWGHHTATVTMPPGAVKAHVYLRSQSMTGTVYWSDVRAEQVLSSGLIGDGAVTAGKIGQAAVDTAQIAERAVTDALIALEAVRAEHLQDASVGVAKFATGIRPVEIVSSLPASGNFPGRVVFLTTDSKLYRFGSGGWTAAVSATDLAGQIEAGQIATGAVGATQLADGSFTVTKFASGLRPVEVVEELPVSGNTVGRTVFLTTDGKLYRYTSAGWTSAVPAADLTGQIGEDLIADAAVTASKIREGAIGAGAFASGLRPIEIVGSLPASGNFPGRVVFLTADSKLYRYDGSQWTAAVPTSDLTGEVGEDLIADAAVTAEKIRSGAVGLAAFASGLRPVEVVSSLPASGNTVGRTVFLTTTGKLHRYTSTGWTSAVPVADLAGQIGTGQIADAAITAQKIGDQAVSTAKIATGAVTQQLIASGAVIAEKLANNAVTQQKIAEGAVTTQAIADAAVAAGKLASSAVYPRHMVAGSAGMALNDDPTMIDLGAWLLNGDWEVRPVSNGPAGTSALRISEATNTNSRSIFTAKAFPVDRGRTYRVSVWANQTAGDGRNYFAVSFLDANGDPISYGAGGASGWPGGGVHHYWGVVNQVLPAGWNRYEFTFGAKGQGTIPAAARSMRIGGQVVRGNTSTSTLWLQDFRVEEVINTTLIADDAITTPKLVALSVTAAKVAAGAIETEKLAADAVTAGKIAAGAVEAAKIAAGAVTTAKLDAFAVTTEKLAAGAVEAGNIAAGAVTTAKLDALAVTAAKIAAGAVEAQHITAGSVTTEKIEAGAVTAAQIAAGAVTTGKLDALAVTADKLAANAVTAGKLAANAVTAGTIAANAITAGTIAAGAVGANEIAAGAVQAEHIRVGSRMLPLANPSVTGSADGWPLGVVGVTNRFGSTVTALESETDANLLRFSDWIDIDPTKTYEVRASLRSIQGHSGATDGGILYFGLQAENAAGSIIAVTPFDPATRSFGTATDNPYFWSGGLGSGAWRDMVGYIIGANADAAEVRAGKNVTAHFRLPPTAQRVRLRWLNWSNGGVTRRAYLWSPTLTPVDATLIHGDGIVANSITTNKLAFEVVGSTNVIASINASTEGLRIQADKIRIDGAVSFGPGYDPTTKETPSGAQAKADAARDAAVSTAASDAAAKAAAAQSAAEATAALLAEQEAEAARLAAIDAASGDASAKAAAAQSAAEATAALLAEQEAEAARLAAIAASLDKETYLTAGTTTIEGGKITTGSIAADRLAVNSAMIGMLNAGVVRAQDIQARAIGVEHLRIGSPALPLANPSITDDPALGWSVSGGGTVSMADGIVRGGTVPRVVRFRSTGDSMYTSDMIEVDPTRTYEVRASLRAHQEFPGSPGARVYFGVVVYDGTGNRIDAATYSVASRTWGSPVNSPYFWTDALPTGAYRDMTAYLLGYGVQEEEVRQGRNVTSHVRLPASAKYVQIRFLNWGNAGTARNLDIYSPTLTPVDATLIHGDGIVAGSITTSKLAFTPLGSDNVVAAINASTEGLRIQADKIRIDGAVSFGPGYDPTTKETPQGAQDKADAAQDAAVAASLDKETYLTPGTTTIAGGQITTGTITADQIAANTITAGQIASGAITADELAAGAVTAEKILAGVIGTDHLAAEAVTTAKLDALAVTADKLAANAVTAGKIAADAVTAGTVAAGAIGADEIAARVINSEHLRIGSLALPLANPSITGSAVGWPLGSVDVTNRHGSTVTALMTETDGNLQRFSEWIDVDPTKTYEVRGSLRSIQGHSGAAGGGILYFGVQAENQAGSLLMLTPFNVATRQFSSGTTTNGYFWSGGLGSGAWRDIVGYILGESVDPADVRQGKNATSHFRLPATTRRIRLQWLNWNNGGTTRRAYLWSPTITPVDATLIHGTGIVTGSITADQIGANAVTAEKILAGEIDTLHLASGAVTTAKLEAGSVTTSILAAEAVVAEKIAAGAIETEKLAANSVVASKIATGEIIARHILAGAITAEKIASGAVTTEKLDAEAVTAAKIAALAVESDKIAANAIHAGHISAGSIQSDHLVSNAVTAGKIAAGAVSADQIAANAITTQKLHASAVTAEKIAANAITAEKIQADAVTADKIATNAVTADALDANSVTAAAILAGSVTADKIAANAITAGKLAVGWTQGASLNSDPGTTDAGAWRTQAGAAGSVVDVGGAGRAGRTALRSVPDGGQWYVFSERVPVESTKTYRASAWARASTAAANGTFYLVVRLLDGALNPIDGDGAGYWFYPRPAIALGTSFEFFQGVFGADTARPIPVSAKYMQIGAFLNAGGTAGSYQMQGVRLEEVIPSVLIKDGAITAAKIRAGAVTADKIDVSDLSAINATFSGDVKLYNQENLLEAYVNDQLEAALVPNRFSIFPPPWQGLPYTIDGVQIAHVNGSAVGVYDDGYVRIGETNDWGPLAPWHPALEVQTAAVTTAGDTAMLLSYHNGTNQRLMRVTVGAPDSGGAGFRVLRVPN